MENDHNHVVKSSDPKPDDALSLRELAEMSGVSERTIRYYIVNNLLEPARGAGPYAWYPASHLVTLKKIKVAQSRGWQLARIEKWLEGGGDLEELDRTPVAPRSPSLDFVADEADIDDWERKRKSERSTWERFVIADGVELHVRKAAMGSGLERKLEKLIDFARYVGLGVGGSGRGRL
jgi:DNA-binding transcriptional MerR regulator